MSSTDNPRAVLVREIGPGSTTVDKPTLALADRVEDNAVGALEEFTSAWARLPPSVPGAAVGSRLHAAIFGAEGLGFLKLRAKLEWAQVEARLKRFDDPALVADLDSLGGTPFLTHLRAAHAAYGVAAGVTQVAPVVETAKVRAALDALTASIRRYVVRVASSVDEASPGSEELAAALLAPITSWVSDPVVKAVALAEPPIDKGAPVTPTA